MAAESFHGNTPKDEHRGQFDRLGATDFADGPPWLESVNLLQRSTSRIESSGITRRHSALQGRIRSRDKSDGGLSFYFRFEHD